MWISGVDIPEELVRAARSGSLVLFVGAGASRDAPAGLPSFAGLTAQIEAESSIRQEPAESADAFLGRLDDSDVDVHERVRAHLDLPGSRPNLLHKAIISLAQATPAPRIVTTNYDTHLSRVVKGRRLGWADYEAPALPMGDDFEGVVYLHGSLRQDPRHLIVTDQDFGRAYLLDAWSARFLERMFSAFTVLFVGYSHDDVVMRYLARSLGRRSGRYVLTSEPDASKWRALGIEPVAYEVRASSHAALGRAVSGWARLLSMGLLDHRQQIARLVAAAPSSIPEEESYLSSVLADEDLVLLFTDLARDEAWLRWAAEHPECRAIFDPAAPWTRVSGVLASWFAERCLSDVAPSNTGLSILAGAGGRMSPALWNAVGQRLHVAGSPRPAWMKTWVVSLIQCAPPDGRDWLDYALVNSCMPDDCEAALLLFDHLTEPHVVLAPSFGLSPGPRIDVGVRGDDHWLRESWDKVLRPALPSIAHDILAIADRSLRRAHQLLTATGRATEGWDPVSFRRSSISPHAQDRHGDEIGHLIDAARDSLELLLNTDSPAARVAIEAWSASDVPILRRLAVHGVTVDSRPTGTDKLTVLLDRGWLFDHQLKHEVFALLAAGLPSAAEQVVDRVVAEASRGPNGVDGDDIDAYETFNALVWIGRHTTAPSAGAALAQVRGEHPDFAVRDHPDLDTWSEGGFVADAAPMAAETFHVLLQQDPAAALVKLDEFDRMQPPFGGLRVEETVEFVRTVVASNPEDGLILLGRDNDLSEPLIRGTLNGWSSSELGDDLARRVADRISLLDLDRWGGDIAPLIGHSAGSEAHTKWFRLEVARDLARAIARQLPEAPLIGEATNWLERAINNTGGWLAEFWLHAISYDWNSDRDAWTGLGAESRGAIEELLQRRDLHGAVAEVILASQLHFFYAADREWCQANVLPLLAWDEPERARRTWDGFLSWGRATDQLLDAGLLRDYLDTTAHVGLFEDEMRRQLAQHLAAAALLGEIDPLSWVTEFARLAPGAFRVEWVNQVGWTLGQLDPDVCVQQWRRWMRAYWERRVASVPVRLTFEEASALAGWVEYLGDATSEAVDLAVATRAGLAPHGLLLHKMREQVEGAPAAYARLLAHLLSHTERPFWGCDDLSVIVAELRTRADDDDIRRIREHALRLGCRGAPDW